MSSQEAMEQVEKWQSELDELYIGLEAKKTYSRNDKAKIKKIIKLMERFIEE